MNRDYADGEIRDDVTYFVGDEIEHTPAFGMKTLFVVGLHDTGEVYHRAVVAHCTHVYLGANQCYTREGNWEQLGIDLLEHGFWVTLDFPIEDYEYTLESCGRLFEHVRFIPQVSVKIPYTSLSNYNTVIKIDDKGFEATNPGVWCHQLHDLMDRSKFTSWDKYKDDSPIN